MTERARHHYDLPSALIAAAEEFEAWSRARLLVEQRESTPTEPLYHYTDETALRSILGTQRLWCFSHEQQKDEKEFEYALHVARKVLRLVSTKSEFFTRSFAECVLDMLAENKLSGPFEFYLVSVSQHRDHGPQWKEYGRDGTGFALALSPALFQPEKDDLYEEANKNRHIGRVVYGDERTFARHNLSIQAAAEITTRVGCANYDLVKATGIAPYLAVMAHELLASQLIWNCLTAKEKRFADEREVRGIIMNVKAKFDPWRRTHNGRSYVEHELPLKAPRSIVEIIVGPKARTGAEEDVCGLLKAKGYPDGIPVFRSTAVLPTGPAVLSAVADSA
jgi:hypothetical protein